MSERFKSSLRTDLALSLFDHPGRFFALVCIVFCFVFTLFWVPDAHAANCSSTSDLCDQGKAYAAAASLADSSGERICRLIGSSSTTYVGPKIEEDPANSGADTGAYSAGVSCSNGGVATAGTTYWVRAQSCSNRGLQTGWLVDLGSPVCHDGCSYAYSPTDHAHAPTGSTCTTDDAPPPKLDSDGDGVPDDSDAFPNDPSESKDSDGDGIGDNGDTAPDDADNGADGGTGNETDNTASGGGTCDAAPACSGDGIACNSLYQQWRTRCAVEGQGGKVTGNPGDCKSSYTCEGNPTGCAQIAVQRASLCQGTGTETGPAGAVSGGGNCSQPYACTGDAIGCAQLRQAWVADCRVKSLFDGDGDDDQEDRDPSDFIGVSDSPNTSLLDAGGWLGSRSCPALNDAAFSGLGTSVATGIRALCDGASALAAFVLVLAYLHASWIIGRSVTGGGA